MYRCQLTCGSKLSEFSSKLRMAYTVAWPDLGEQKNKLLISVGWAWGKGIKRYKLGV